MDKVGDAQKFGHQAQLSNIWAVASIWNWAFYP